MGEKWIPVFPADPEPVRVPARGIPPVAPRSAPSPGGRHSDAQNALYRAWMEAQTPLILRCRDGLELRGQLRSFDTYALHLQDEAGTDLLVFKHGIIAIAPAASSADV